MAHKITKLVIRRQMYWTILFFILPILGGCHGFRGAKVSEPNQISLLGGKEGGGIWNTQDLTLSYRFFRNETTVRFSGRVQLRRTNLRYFNLRVYFLDSQGEVIDETGVTTSNRGGPLTFNTEKTIPEGAQAFAFGYKGEFVGTEMGTVPFWQYPFERGF